MAVTLGELESLEQALLDEIGDKRAVLKQMDIDLQSLEDLVV